MSVDRTYKFFGFSTSYTVLNLPLSILYLPFMLLLPRIKDKERILKAAREKETVTYKEVLIRLSADFSKETLQARRGWKEVFKGKDIQPRWLYPAKLSFRMEGQIKCFPDKVKLKEFIITKSLLYEILKGLI